jgi:TetR/AcrR family acrAB operon transcriptional repressor
MNSTGARKKPVESGESRRELLAIAIDCFALHGYQGTSIDKIAKAAGVTKGALYYHFRDKEDLLFQAVRDRVMDFEHRVVAEVTPIEDPVQTLRHIADSCIFVATRNNHRRFLLTLMVEAIDSHADLSIQFREMMQRFRAYVAGIVRLAQERGIFRFDVEPPIAAQVFIAGIMGSEIQHYQDAEEVSLETVMANLVDGFFTWMAAGATARTGEGSGPGSTRPDAS